MALEGPLPGSSQGGVFRRILVGYDGSKEAQHALRIALALAADLHGEVQVLAVVRPPAHAETPEELARAAEAERENLSRGFADLGSQARHGSEPQSHVVFADDPARAIAEHVADHGFDLVVVGDHGREQITHRGIGRSVEALLRHHPCPVLVV
jgi:nucleotide-binding universal stress UspA family protein